MVANTCGGKAVGWADWDSMGFRALLHENKLLELVVTGEFTPLLLQQIVRYVEHTVEDVGPLAGLMLDLRQSDSISVVRVTGLDESLSTIVTPMAVVFIWRQQHEIARLIHHTLPRRDDIAYFTHHTDAWTYLLRHLGDSSPP